MAFRSNKANPDRLSQQASSRSSRALPLLVLAGLILGGAGERYLALELALAIAAAVLLLRAASRGALLNGRSMRRFLALALIWFGLALVFMVPVPPFLWHSVAQANAAGPVLSALGLQDSWRAMGLDPDRAMLVFLSLPLPLAGFWLTYSGSAKQIAQAVQVLVAVAAASALLACLQFGSGGLSAFYVFATSHQGSGSGLFVNRNHLALLLLATMPFLASAQAFPASWHGFVSARILRFGTLTLLAFGVLATVSRTAFALLLPVVVFVVWKLQQGEFKRYTLVKAVAVFAFVGFLASQMPVSRALVERYGSLAGDFRYNYWENTLYLLSRHFPFGTGPGSFSRLYASVEPLTQVRPQFVGHAHNDWMEVALEFGLPGVLCLLLLIALIAMAARQALARAPLDYRPVVTAALAGLVLVGVFSLVDFPLRMPAIALVSSVLLGLLARNADRETMTPIIALEGLPRSAAITLSVSIGLLLSCTVVSRQLVRGGLAQAASAIAPWSASARSARAQVLADNGDWVLAGQDARAALEGQPLDPRALRILAGAQLAAGRSTESGVWLSLAASMGWRDRATQEWVARAAQSSGQIDAAVERYDALLRQEVDDDLIYRNLVQAVSAPGGVRAIVNRLEERPGWTRGFFNALGMAPPATQVTLQLLAELQKRTVPAIPRDTALLRWTLWERGQFANAAKVWRASGGTALLGDGTFADLDGELPVSSAPYVWSSPRQPGVSVVAVTDGTQQSKHAVQVTSDGSAVGTMLSQTVALESGLYTISLRTAEASTLPLRLSVTCFDARLGRWNDSGLVLAARPSAGASSGLVADFLAQEACPALALNIGIARATGQEGQVTIEQAEIRKVAIDRAGTGRALDLP